MRNDLSASEKRLIAALDRIDAYLDHTARGTESPPAKGDPQDASPSLDAGASDAEAQEDTRRLSVAEQRHATVLADLHERLDEAQRQLAAAGRQAVAMTAANEALSRANRKLLDAGGQISAEDAHAALLAELEALRAARGAEISQIGGIVDALDRMLDRPASDAGRAVSKSSRATRTEPDAVLEDGRGAEVADGERD